MYYKLEKDMILYRHQFEKIAQEIYRSHHLDRTSIELDGLLFRIKYMLKHNKDLDKINRYEKEFAMKAYELRNIFSNVAITFLTRIVGIPEPFKFGNIIDILSKDVKMDAIHVKFTMILISDNEEYLKYVDDTIPDDEVYNLFPNDFFRVYTESYNDGITKAFPELFEIRSQNKVGKGNDADVFVHNFTFQTGEACSLNCTYCLVGDTPILMGDGTQKYIMNIQVGDTVEGFEKSKVTEVMMRETDEVYHIKFKSGKELKITGEHPIFTPIGIFEAGNLREGDRVLTFKNGTDIVLNIEKKNERRYVYNLETESHTYVANGIHVHNCYQFNKTPMRMSFETAKEFIDNLLADKYGYINRYNSPAIILEFIGGEPLLEIKLTRKIYEYFLDRCYELDHPWFTMHRLSICSNGMQYFDDEVQEFFKEYHHNISFNISIDGNKELHDACRIQPNGEGSYDIDMIALKHYTEHYSPDKNSKMTLAPSNIKYLFDSVVDFISKGMVSINLNCVFEEGWNQLTALEEYNQLKKLADYILEKDLEYLYIALFRERQESKQDKYNDGNFCGGLSSMLALRPNGQFYTCIRYMPTSVGNNVKDLCIGNVKDGFIGREENSEILQMMDSITRRSQSNDICYECPMSSACAWCSALGHTVYGTPNKRPMFICIQMIAETLANVYYWNLLNIKKPQYKLGVRKNVVPDEWALLVIDKDELKFLKSIEAYSMIITLENSGWNESIKGYGGDSVD